MPLAPYSQGLQNWSNLGLGRSKKLAQILVETLPQGVQKCLLKSCSFLACALRAQARNGQKGRKHFWNPRGKVSTKILATFFDPPRPRFDQFWRTSLYGAGGFIRLEAKQQFQDQPFASVFASCLNENGIGCGPRGSLCSPFMFKHLAKTYENA